MKEPHVPKLSRVVTQYFWVFEPVNGSRVQLRPGLDFLVATLIRNCAHEILVPFVEPRYGRPIKDVIRDFPPTIANRIRVIDKNAKTRNRVLTYLQPVYEETKNSPLAICTNIIFGFLYNLTLAASNEAEADVEALCMIDYLTAHLRDSVESAEARARLDQLIGIYRLYDRPTEIPVLVMRTGAIKPSVYERINEILDEATIQCYSHERYLLGIPGKAKASLISLKKWAMNKLVRKYSILKLATECIQVVSGACGTPLSIPDIAELIAFRKYNPPLIDLDYYRVEICKQLRPGTTPNFIMPDGATRAYRPDYFKSTTKPTRSLRQANGTQRCCSEPTDVQRFFRS